MIASTISSLHPAARASMHQRGQAERKNNPANPLGAPRPHAADHGVRGAPDERSLKNVVLFRAIRIVARVHAKDATRPVPRCCLSRWRVGACAGGDEHLHMSGRTTPITPLACGPSPSCCRARPARACRGSCRVKGSRRRAARALDPFDAVLVREVGKTTDFTC